MVDRVLVGIRQSKRKELSESPATQRADIHAWAERAGNPIIGEAEDLGVSASIEPAKRKSLGPWLTDPHRLAQWDVLAFWKIDRAVRDLTHFYGFLVPELQRLGKNVVAVSEGVDTRTSSGIEVAMRVSMAQDELKKLKDRARNSRKGLRDKARWGGGPPYFGYYSVKTSEGYKLAIDEDAMDVLHTVLDLLRLGYTVNYAAGYLNQEGVLTAWDRNAIRQGREPKGRIWRRKTLDDMLKSRHLLGHGMYRGEVIRDDEGNPRQFGDPIFTRAEWDEIQELIRQPPRSYRRKGSSMLRQVAFCNSCGRTMTRHPGGNKDIPRYVCIARSLPGYKCKSSGYPATELEQAIEEQFLDEYGDLEVEEVRAVRITDHGLRLQEISEALDQLETDRYVKGRFTGDEGARRFDRLYAQLESEREELTAQQQKTPGIEVERTGETYRQLWEKSSPEERGNLLRKFGVYAMVQWRLADWDSGLVIAPYVSLSFPMLDK